MNVSTAAVSFDDGAVGIELFDRAAAVPERGSPGLPPEGLRPAAPGSQSLRNLWCGFFFLKIYICGTVSSCPFNDPDGFGGARRALRVRGEDKKFGKRFFRFASIATP